MIPRRIVIFTIVVLALACCIYCETGYQRGRADFDAVVSGKPPIYATERIPFGDGGTVGFLGRGYMVYQMHQILREFHPAETESGFLGGAKIEWNFPIRIFVHDDASYWYVSAH